MFPMRKFKINGAHVMKWFVLFFVVSSFFEMNIFAKGVHFRSGEIRQAVVKNGFDVSENGVDIPVLISFNDKDKYLSRCHIFAKASPDFYRNKSYLYISKIECNGHTMNYSAYVADKRMNFGIPSYPKLYNSKKYLHVITGTSVNIVFTPNEDSQVASSHSG